MTNRTKSELISHCRIGCKDELLVVVPNPVSRMLTTNLEWLTDFLTGVIMESHMLIGASLLALAKSIYYIFTQIKK